MSIGKKIREFRVEHLLTLKAAADLFGVSQAEISRLESERNGTHFITEKKWEKKLEEAKEKIVKGDVK
jgi:transcriptional regulator with XRE-family HTH domain